MNEFIKTFNWKDILENTLLFFGFLIILDIFNVPTFIINYNKNLEMVLIITVVFYFIINNRIFKLLKINVINYIDLFLVSLFFSTVTYILINVLMELTEFKLISSLILIGILIIIFIIRIKVVLRKFKSEKFPEVEFNVYDLRDLYKNKIGKKDNKLILLEEKAVKYDLLNRTKIITDLYNSINFCKNKEKFIISITGEWGSGKTTILNIVKEKLDKEKFIIIDDFDIWKYSNEKSLIYGIVDEILKKININFSSLRINEIVNGCLGILSSRMDIKLKYISSGNKMIEKLKIIVNNYLEKNDKRIILIIDNLERTNSNNILIVLKAISTVLGMERFIYVLSYDEEEMKSIFEEKLKINYDYVEKIIQLPLRIPEISRERINKISNQCLKNLLLYYGEDNNKIEEYITGFQIFSENIKDLRGLKRKINSIVNTCFFGINDLNKNDYFIIELINQENHKLYIQIKENCRFFASEDVSKIYGEYIWDQVSFNKEATKYFDDLFNIDENKKYKKILEIIFPNVKKYNEDRKNNERVQFEYEGNNIIISRDNEKYRDSIINKRIYNARFFDLYFTKDENEFIEIIQEIDEFIKWNNNSEYQNDEIEEKLEKILYLYNGINHKEILEIFEFYIKYIEKNKYSILKYLINNQQYMKNDIQFLGINTKRRAEIICSKIIEILSKEEAIKISQKIESDYKNVYFISNILYFLNSDKEYNKKDNSEEVVNLINESYKILIENIFNNNINIYSTENYSRHNMWCIMRDERIKKILEFIDKYTVFRFLSDFITESIGTYGYGYGFDIKNFKEITTYEFIDNIINKIDLNKISEIEKMIYEIYDASKTNEEFCIYREEYIDLGKI